MALSVADCDEAGVPTQRLLELIRAEVVAADFVIIDASSPSPSRGVIELCHGSPQRVWMRVGVDSQPTVERIVDLGDVEGELRARTVAVAFAELLSMLRRDEAASTPTSGPTQTFPRAAPPPAPPRQVPPRESRREPSSRAPTARTAPLQVVAGLGFRVFAPPSTILGGPWLAVGSVRFQAEGFYLQTSQRVALGTAHLRSLGAAAVWSPWQLGAGPRVSLHCRGELGMTWAAGSPADGRVIGSTRSHGQAALAAELRLDVPLFRALSLQGRLTTGLAYGPTATAENVAVARASGPFVGAGLGIKIGF